MSTTAVLPPGPAWSGVRQSLAWIVRPMPFMEQMRNRYGDVFTVKIFGGAPMVFVSDPELVREVLLGDPETLRAGEGNAILGPVVGRRSLLLLDGADHLAQRRMMLPAFQGDRMKAYGDLMAAAAAREIERWPDHGTLEAWPRMQAITLEIIVEAVFGVTDSARATALRTALTDMLDWVNRPSRLVRLAVTARKEVDGEYADLQDLRRATDGVHALLQEELDARRRAGADDAATGDDVLSLLLSARDADGRGLTDEELRDQLITLLVAGHETTATTLAWALERLVRHPPALRRAVAEADDGERDAPWIDAVIRETLRLRPVLPIVVRRTKAEITLGDHRLPAGVDVCPCIHLLHRRPDVYPEPHAFRPQRFLDVAPGTYTWLPFGGGVRRCLGASFALYEARVVLREILRRVTVEPIPGPTGLRPERIARRAITLTPGHGAQICVTRRTTPTLQR